MGEYLDGTGEGTRRRSFCLCTSFSKAPAFGTLSGLQMETTLPHGKPNTQQFPGPDSSSSFSGKEVRFISHTFFDTLAANNHNTLVEHGASALWKRYAVHSCTEDTHCTPTRQETGSYSCPLVAKRKIRTCIDASPAQQLGAERSRIVKSRRLTKTGRFPCMNRPEA